MHRYTKEHKQTCVKYQQLPNSSGADRKQAGMKAAGQMPSPIMDKTSGTATHTHKRTPTYAYTHADIHTHIPMFPNPQFKQQTGGLKTKSMSYIIILPTCTIFHVAEDKRTDWLHKRKT